MKNNKAFTLVEVIAVIVILGVVLSIAVPSITNVVNSTNKNRMKSDAELFISKVKEYVESDTTGNVNKKVTLGEIKLELSNNYERNSSYVNVNIDNNTYTYTYTVCLTDGKLKAVGPTGNIKVREGNCSENE